MSRRRVEIDGRFYRERRGKLVEIPQKWVGRVTSQQTIRKRPSKLTHKLRRLVSPNGFWKMNEFKDRRDALGSDPGEYE